MALLFIEIFSLFLAGITPFFFLVALYQINKQKPIHDSLRVIWLLGFVYSIMRVGVQTIIIFPNSWQNWWAQLIILISVTSAGIEHWLFSLNYYTSASKIIGDKKNIFQRNFFQIFWGVSALYFVCEIAACIGSAFIAANLVKQGVQAEDTLQVIVYLALNTFSNVLIILSLRKLNAAVKGNPELKNNR